MLTIVVNDDKSITITSDDQEAENANVGDDLRAADLSGEADHWDAAPFVDGLLTCTYVAEDAPDVLEALEDRWPQAGEALIEILPPHVGGGPKPTNA